MDMTRECRDLNCPAHGRMLRRIRRLVLAVADLRAHKADLERAHREHVNQERGAGWDRAHTMLCHDVYPKCQHRNPWMRVRAKT
jgi:hypothetical protein